jgi:hypothetical protein
MAEQVYKLDLGESRPDFGPDHLSVEDLEPGMPVELVVNDKARILGVLAVGKRYLDPNNPDKFVRRQCYVGDPGMNQLEVVDDPNWVIVADKWRWGSDETSELLPVALELDYLGLGPVQTEEGMRWHQNRHLRRSSFEPGIPGLQAALLHAVTTLTATIRTPEQSAPQELGPTLSGRRIPDPLPLVDLELGELL